MISTNRDYDLICVGGGIMSATLALILKLSDPTTKILILERLDKVAEESTKAWNNAGTGHSAFCELNYTPQDEDGNVDISKAIEIFQQFERSKQFWSYLVDQKLIRDPKSFIHSIPHHAWVRGEDDVKFLKKRFEAMKSQSMFENMKFSDDFEQLEKWFPLIMEHRSPSEIMAATRMELGTGVNFGSLTEQYFKILEEQFNVPVLRNKEVLDIDPDGPEEWSAEVEDRITGEKTYYDAEHIFIGAGGGALPLLQKVEIKEKDGYGGFPVSGQWLFCKNREIIEKHHAKVYSKAGVDAPPMSVPHMDARFINGKKELLFGPFAGFSTKFLKQGSILDLPKSLKFDNLPSMWGVFWHNLPLTSYLINQVRMDHQDRINDLKVFIKDARAEDWELKVAGQRVQIIKKDEKEGGVLEFGTDVVHSNDGKITALLGASPGASTAVHIMLEVIELAFPEKLKKQEVKAKLDKMIPFWNKDVREDEEKFKEVQKSNSESLQLEVSH
ncbi:malate dehydrogenase (quinone) [Christiangramia sp. SM2212]|uniref:Probable malate:quinone oxidoreductase n=1 Tax=Christiangramia sediminicola TaxID=3073267 RepID=A0ABU1ER83_9FLAO|nr:malate dehydrogenase (quinone) [Christiangramia sp. SM2212]MDR5590895.1 malate dehydrogenase (quinone) [Christiangramia sp. SM2212]